MVRRMSIVSIVCCFCNFTSRIIKTVISCTPNAGDFQRRSVYVSLAVTAVCHVFLSSHWWVQPSRSLSSEKRNASSCVYFRMRCCLPYTSTVEQRNYWWPIPHKIRQRRYCSFRDLSDCHKCASFIFKWSRRRKIQNPNMVRHFHFEGFLLLKVVRMVLWGKQWLMRGAWVSGIWWRITVMQTCTLVLDIIHVWMYWSNALDRCVREDTVGRM